MSTIVKLTAAAGLVAAAAIGAGTAAQAAPLPTSVAKLGKAAATPVETVQYRRANGRGWRGGGWRRYGGHRYSWRSYGWRGYPYRYGYGWGWGWPYYYGAGIVVGSAVAAPYYYEPPVYVAPAEPAPATVSGAKRQCWVDTDSSRGYGYWQPC